MYARAGLTLSIALGALETFAADPAGAQDARVVTTTWVYLRGSPSKTGARLRTMPPGDTLSVRVVPGPKGWTPVRTGDGKAGWVGTAILKDVPTTVAGGGGPVGGRGARGRGGPDTSAAGTAGGAAATRIDTSWAKPAIATSTIRMRGNTISCGPRGDGADDGTNFHKNRADTPASSHFITLEAIRALPDTALWRFKGRSNWTRADSALVLPYEGIPVTVEGYFEIVKPQSTSAPTGTATVGESPNCHSWAELDTDWHMALVADPSEHEERAVVVEPTPRTKRNNSGWTPTAAKALAVRHSAGDTRHEAEAAKVRVTGYLMLDPVHPDHIRGDCKTNCAGRTFFRATLWEVHPVTKIEVWKVDKWVDLNNVP
jgi:hypothetical protein